MLILGDLHFKWELPISHTLWKWSSRSVTKQNGKWLKSSLTFHTSNFSCGLSVYLKKKKKSPNLSHFFGLLHWNKWKKPSWSPCTSFNRPQVLKEGTFVLQKSIQSTLVHSIISKSMDSLWSEEFTVELWAEHVLPRYLTFFP